MDEIVDANAGNVADVSSQPTGDVSSNAGTGDVATPPPVASPTEGSAEAGTADPVPPATPPVDEFSELYEKLDDPAPVDPAQVQAPSIAPEVSAALESGKYITSPEQIPTAITAANELFAVQKGDLHTGDFIDAFKETDPARYEQILAEAAEYLRAVKPELFGQQQQKQIDPELQKLQQEVQGFKTEQQKQRDAENKQQYERQVSQTRETFASKLGEFTKGTWIEGAESDFSTRVLKQLDNLKISPQQFAEDMRKGNTENLSKAYKAAKNEVLDLVKMYSKNITDHKARARKTTPAAPGQGGGPITSGGGVNRADFPAGPEGLREFQTAYAKATNLFK